MKRNETRSFERVRPVTDENPVDKLRAMHERLAIRTSQARRKAMPPMPPPKPEPEPEPVAEESTPAPAGPQDALKPSKSRWK